MRKIKLKLWDKGEKKWETIRSIGLDEDGSIFYIQCWDESERDIDPPYFMDNLGVDFELVQFTGLSDTNGREIYEGDIVLDSKTKEVLGYIGFIQQECAYKLITKDWELRIDHRGLDGHELEVVGNMYQHRHLLKG